MNRGSWKRVEREVALHLGGRRVPVTGRSSGDVEDVEHVLYAIEVKARKRLPLLLVEAMVQAVRAGKRTAKIPLVVAHQAGSHHDNDLVVMRMKDFRVFCPTGSQPLPAGISYESDT